MIKKIEDLYEIQQSIATFKNRMDIIRKEMANIHKEMHILKEIEEALLTYGIYNSDRIDQD